MFRKPLNVDACPKPAELEDYAAKALYGKRNEEIFLHLKYCARCLRRMGHLTRTPTAKEIIQGAGRPAWWQRLQFWRRPQSSKTPLKSHRR